MEITVINSKRIYQNKYSGNSTYEAMIKINKNYVPSRDICLKWAENTFKDFSIKEDEFNFYLVYLKLSAGYGYDVWYDAANHGENSLKTLLNESKEIILNYW